MALLPGCATKYNGGMREQVGVVHGTRNISNILQYTLLPSAKTLTRQVGKVNYLKEGKTM